MFPCDASSITFVSWNANGLLTAEGLPDQRRKAKGRALKKIIHDFDVVAIQEAHGQREHRNTFKHQLAKSHKVFDSTDPDSPSKAGVALIIRLKIYR